jgi:hypothetical protein
MIRRITRRIRLMRNAQWHAAVTLPRCGGWALAGAGFCRFRTTRSASKLQGETVPEDRCFPADEGAPRFGMGSAQRVQKQGAPLGAATPMELFDDLPASGFESISGSGISGSTWWRILLIQVRPDVEMRIRSKCGAAVSGAQRIAEFAATLPENFKAGKLVFDRRDIDARQTATRSSRAEQRRLRYNPA